MLKICVIGAGGIADRRMIPAIIKSKNCMLVGVMDRVTDVAESIGKKYGVPHFTSESEMLKQVDCDAVYIATPVAVHYEQALLSLKFDKHVFIEKPIAINGKVAKEIVSEFKQKNKQITVGYMMKYHNLHQKARQLIDSGSIGQANSVRAQFSCWYPKIEGAWRQNKALSGGGAIMDLGVHCIELIEYLLCDEIAEVKSFYSTRTFSYEVDDGAVIIFRTKGGVLGHIDVNFNIPDSASESKLEIYGSEGYIICNGTLAQTEGGKLKYLYAPQDDYSAMQNRTEIKPKTYYGKNGDLYQKQLEIFYNDVNGAPNYFYADCAVHVQEIIDEIYNYK